MLDTELYIIGFTFVAAALVVFFVALFSAKSWKTDNSAAESEEDEKDSSENQNLHNSNGHAGYKKANNKKLKGSKPDKQALYSHPWLASNLKGHSGEVLDIDFSSNGKHLVSSAEDRQLFIWNTKDFLSKEHKSVKGTVELDHAKLVRFAPDCKSLVLVLSFANRLAVYKMAKKEEGSTWKIQPVEGVEFPDEHVQEITSVGIACNGRFIMTASSDTKIIVWSIRGDVLKVLDTKQSILHHATVSPCGRFVASSGFTPDVPVWEVNFSRNGDFEDVSRAFELKGHTSGISSFDFNQDSTRMVTVSKDGTWRLWDTDIRYKQGQDPRLLRTGKLEDLKTYSPKRVQVSLAPNGDSFAIVTGNTLRVYRWLVDSDRESPDGEMTNVHREAITAVRFSGDSKFVVSSGDRQLRLFHNISYYKALVANTAKLVKEAKGEAHKERLKEQAKEARDFLKTIVGASDV